MNYKKMYTQTGKLTKFGVSVLLGRLSAELVTFSEMLKADCPELSASLLDVQKTIKIQ